MAGDRTALPMMGDVEQIGPPGEHGAELGVDPVRHRLRNAPRRKSVIWARCSFPLGGEGGEPPTTVALPGRPVGEGGI